MQLVFIFYFYNVYVRLQSQQAIITTLFYYLILINGIVLCHAR